jgi:CubicO group peptidase (beta-lactamase class C family)
VAKTLVSAALAALVADGRLGWDDPLVGYVPEFGFPDPVARERVSLRDCAANRLGLAREGFCEWGASEQLPVTDLLGRLAHTPLERPLRSGFSYVNPGHSAAALVVSRVTGMPFLEFVRQRLLEPAGIEGVAAGAEARSWPLRSECHVFDADGNAGELPVATRVDPLFADNAIGGTGVWMAPQAIKGWLQLHLGQGSIGDTLLMPAAAHQQICIPHVTVPEADQPFGVGPGECAEVGYGLGWFCTRYRGQRLLHHGGAEVGANAHLTIAPDAGVAVGVVANAASPAADVIGLTLMDALLGLPALPWARRAQAAHPQTQTRERGLNLRHGSDPGAALGDYAGRYRHAGNGPADITVRGPLLEIRFTDAPRFNGHLQPLGGGWFSPRPSDIAVRSVLSEPAEFTLENGRAMGFSLPGFGTWRRA